jgi:hypothetical protein
MLLPALASAQGGELPTLSRAGLEYLSSSGHLQVTLSGQLDLESLLVGGDRFAGLVGHTRGDSIPADWVGACADCHATEGVRQAGKGGLINAPRLRVFADVFLGDHVYSLVEVRGDRGPAPANRRPQVGLEQAFVRIVSDGARAGVQAGRFASPFGAYPLRHLTVVDPFLRPPLPYDYRTTMNSSLAPADVADLLRWKNWPELFRAPGVPPVWDVPYQWGAMLFGRLGPADLRVAAMNSAPSSDPEVWGFDGDRLRHPSWVVGTRVKASASLELGASYSRGPWMEEITRGVVLPPPGAPADAPVPSHWDFEQEIVSADFAYARGPAMVRGEAMLDFWQVPNVSGRPSERLFTLEVQTDVGPGLSVAGRVGYIDFRPVSLAAGGRTDWDDDVLRTEASLGYRLVRNAGALVSAYRQSARGGESTALAGLRLWWAF